MPVLGFDHFKPNNTEAGTRSLTIIRLVMWEGQVGGVSGGCGSSRHHDAWMSHAGNTWMHEGGQWRQGVNVRTWESCGAGNRCGRRAVRTWGCVQMV